MSESVIELHLERKLPLKMEKFVSTDGGAENGFRNAAAPQTEMKGKSHYGVRYGYKMTILLKLGQYPLTRKMTIRV